MEQRSVIVTVGKICIDLASNLNYMSQIVSLQLIAKKCTYGCKLVIFAEDKRTDKTIFYTLVKIHSVKEADTLPALMGGFEEYLHKYYNIPDSSCNPSD